MDMAILPYEGVGDLRFGQTVADVHTILGNPSRSLLIHTGDVHPSDAYGKQGIVVHYDQSGKVEAVEFSGPVQPTYHNKALVGLTVAEAESWMERVDEDAQIDPPDFTSPATGIAFYALAGKIAAVMAFRRGYYGEE